MFSTLLHRRLTTVFIWVKVLNFQSSKLIDGRVHAQIQRGRGQGSRALLKSYSNRFLGKTGAYLRKKLKSNHASIQCLSHNRPASKTLFRGYHQTTSETPAKWRFAVGPMMTRFYWYLVHQLEKKI